jgi:RimJ/RimL family protein N-acetyltransferase/predicted N-acetyltransferase YhbS
MHTRPVRAGELESFAEVGAPEHHEDYKRHLENMFAAGTMSPEGCFVIEEEGEILGRVAFWTLPATEEPYALELLDLGWDGNYLSVGVPLLRNVLGEARALGSKKIVHVLDAPPMYPWWQESPEKRVELLENARLTMKRETSRFEWRRENVLPIVPKRLAFRTLEEVGEEAFVEAMARVSEGTLDRAIQDERERMGPEEAARKFFEGSDKLEYDASWWQLAYDRPGGELVGLVMPAKNPVAMTINYIGVVPEHRGKGYVDDLLALGTATLQEAGPESITADTDARNKPMAAAFERTGWAWFAGRREYVADLSSDRA